MTSCDWTSAIRRTCQDLQARGARPHRLVVRQHGRTVADWRLDPWQPDLPGLVYSVSKTFTSAAVGLAVGDGAFDYDDRLVDLWPQVRTCRTGPVAASIRVRDALAMATGHSQEQADSMLVARRPDLSTAQRFMATEPAGRPGVDFAYNNLATWLLGRIVARHTGLDVETLLGQRVFDPLGITDHSWQRDADGQPLGFSGLHLNPEGLARFGQLLLDGGLHDGVPLLPQAWIREHRRHQVRSDGAAGPDWGQGYGWQTWLSRHGFRLDGAFGQFVLVLEEVDAVVVITSNAESNAVGGPATMQGVLEAAWDHLWPQLVADRAPAEPVRLVEELPPVSGAHDSARSSQALLDDGTHVVAAPGAQGWTLSWDSPHGPALRFGVGHGRWQHTACRTEHGGLDVAASGGWTDDGLVVDLAVVSSPHTLHLVLAGPHTRARWDTEPLNPGGLVGLLHPIGQAADPASPVRP